MNALLLAVVASYVGAFLAGYGVRAYISHRRHRLVSQRRRQDEADW